MTLITFPVPTLDDILKEKIRTVPDFPDKGVQFKDIQSILIDAELRKLVKEGLIKAVPMNGSAFAFDAVLCFDARGFIFAGAIADAAEVGVIMARKKGKLPPPVISQEYLKEYGPDLLQVEEGLIKPGMRILIHDDALATGGTSAAAAIIVQNCGGTVVGFNYIIELEALGGKQVLAKYLAAPTLITSLVTYR
jgi:adenine phosphoribosyltransferase